MKVSKMRITINSKCSFWKSSFCFRGYEIIPKFNHPRGKVMHVTDMYVSVLRGPFFHLKKLDSRWENQTSVGFMFDLWIGCDWEDVQVAGWKRSAWVGVIIFVINSFHFLSRVYSDFETWISFSKTSFPRKS